MDESQTSIAPSEPWPFDPHDEEARAKYIISEIERTLSDGQEESAASLISLACGNFGKWRSANVLWMFYKRFTDPAILYRCIIDTYTNDGYKFPRRVMLRAKKIAPSIPAVERFGDLPAGDVLTVYRAANTPINKVRNDLSWTINKNVALWFGYRLSDLYGEDFDPLHVYTGTIERDKIIAYTNDRNEYEVIQHGSVKDITEIHPTNEEIVHAMEWKAEQHNKAELEFSKLIQEPS